MIATQRQANRRLPEMTANLLKVMEFILLHNPPHPNESPPVFPQLFAIEAHGDYLSVWSLDLVGSTLE
jgi:hypothetical protein